MTSRQTVWQQYPRLALIDRKKVIKTSYMGCLTEVFCLSRVLKLKKKTKDKKERIGKEVRVLRLSGPGEDHDLVLEKIQPISSDILNYIIEPVIFFCKRHL